MVAANENKSILAANFDLEIDLSIYTKKAIEKFLKDHAGEVTGPLDNGILKLRKVHLELVNKNLQIAKIDKITAAENHFI